jgi:tetratricopeptide (TPR) repeat protein
VTSIADAYRDSGEWGLLASFYDAIGNQTLRDKYVEKALAVDPFDAEVIHLRAMQGRRDLIPEDVIERETRRYDGSDDWSQRARFYRDLDRPREAVMDYARSVLRSLERDETSFSAAYYLRELCESRLHEDLYLRAFERARSDGDLWWQARALQDLGRRELYDGWLQEHAADIEESQDRRLLADLARARGDIKEAERLRVEIARGLRSGIMTESGPVLRADLAKGHERGPAEN